MGPVLLFRTNDSVIPFDKAQARMIGTLNKEFGRMYFFLGVIFKYLSQNLPDLNTNKSF